MNTQQKERIVGSIATLQCILRYRYQLYDRINTHVHVLSNCILMMTEQLHHNYIYKIRAQALYNELMTSFETISHDFLGIKDTLDATRRVRMTPPLYFSIKKRLNDVHVRLQQIYHQQGSKTLNDIVQLEFRIDIHTIPNSTFLGWWIHFLNATFVPLTFDVYRVCGHEDITLLRNPSTGGNPDERESGRVRSDIGVIRKILEYLRVGSACDACTFCYPLSSSAGAPPPPPRTDGDDDHKDAREGTSAALLGMSGGSGGSGGGGGGGDGASGGGSGTAHKGSATLSLVEHLNGARVYVSLERSMTHGAHRCVVACDGYFRSDCFHLMQAHDHLRTKYKELRALVETNASIPTTFRNRWVKQLSLRDVMVYNVHDLNARCLQAHQKLQQFKSQTIANMVKNFLATPLHNQLDTLTLFLLTEEDSDTQYLAYLMYDMISQESYLLKPQPLAEEIYNNLHWTIKKRFRIVIENVGHYTRKLTTDFTDNDINYESRIYLMKCSDSVKKRAYDKLKEVQAKSGNENAHKAQQYLDGILRIPFGVYRKETIFSFLDQFREVFLQYCHQCLHTMTPALAAASERVAKLRALHNDILQMPFVTAHHIERFMQKMYQSINVDVDVDVDVACASEKMALAQLTHAQMTVVVNSIKRAMQVRALKYKDAHGRRATVRLKRKKGGVLVMESGERLAQALIQWGAHVRSLPNGIGALAQATSGVPQPLRTTLCKALQLQTDDDDDDVEGDAGACSDPVATEGSDDAGWSPAIANQLQPCVRRFQSIARQWESFGADTKAYMKSVEETLDASVYGHAPAKTAIKQVIAQWITGELKGYTFGFEGPPGTGKTSLAKRGLAHCLKDADGRTRPFAFIALGGSCNGSTLEGHSYTYVGSTWGRIVDILMETQCTNPIIFIDELDKLSKTEHGREIVGILTHMTDSTGNDEIQDKYFAGVKLDLSKALFVFSYNDPSLIDPILRDRIHRIKFSPLKQDEKKHVCRLHIVPDILRTIGLSEGDVVISDEIIDFIIDNYTCEGGARRLKEKLFEILREVNMRNLLDPERYPMPYTITTEFLANDLFADHAIVQTKKILPAPRIGLTNGLYASASGVGGITVIEAFRIPTSTFMSLELTGQQGKVMKESMSVAKTVAWNLLTRETRAELHRSAMKDANKDGVDGVATGDSTSEAAAATSRAKDGPFGLHIHCPEGATPKDGPSAGTAITISILSSLLKLPVNNTVAITGEIDLNGTVCQIGGLDTKVRGAKKAGVRKVLFPASNAHDIVSIEKHGTPFDETMSYKLVETIWDVLPEVFPDSTYPFMRFTE